MKNELIEEWKDIPDFKDVYQISNYGNVRSLDRWIKYTCTKKITFIVNKFINGKSKSIGVDRHGYALLTLFKNGKQKVIRPHRLVAELFLDMPSHGRNEVNHIDGNPLNNYFQNLEWCTHAENMRHAVTTGLLKNRDNSQKLVWEDAISIRRLYKTGNYGQWELARKFNVSQAHINNIIKNRTWKRNAKYYFKKNAIKA